MTRTIPQGLRILADWFDVKFKDAGAGEDEVQQDLRRWADEIEAMEARICPCLAEHDAYQHMMTRALRAEARAEQAEHDWYDYKADFDARFKPVTDVLRELDRFQNFYSANTREKGMPGNEFYSEKLMEIVDHARTILAGTR